MAQQSAGDGPVMLRPPPGIASSRTPVAGQMVSAGGNVIVNMNAIGGSAAAPPYGGANAYAPVPYAPAYVGTAPRNYYNRPPLPGEVPLVDEDPIVLRPPGPDGYGQAVAASRPVLRPPGQTATAARPRIETRELPPKTAAPAPKTMAKAAPAQTGQTQTQTRPVAAKPDTTATAAKPAPKPAATAASTQTASSQPAASSGPTLRSTVRTQPAPADSTGGSTGTEMAAATPATPTPKPAMPSGSTSGSGAATGSSSDSGNTVTLPATTAPARETARVPSPPSAATDTKPAPESKPAAAAPRQTASAEAPERTLPAVPQGDGDGDGVTLTFKAGDSTLDKAAEGELAKLAAGMKDSSDRLQIKAYANAPESGSSSSARRLSLSRALSVRSYLIDQGIRSTRIDVRALGDTGSGQLDRVDISLAGRS